MAPAFTTFGAAILIAATLIYPFVQQLVRCVNCHVNITTPTTIPRTAFFNPNMMPIGAETPPSYAEEAPAFARLFAVPADIYVECSTTAHSTVGAYPMRRHIAPLIFNDTDPENVTTALPDGVFSRSQRRFGTSEPFQR